MEFNSKQAEGSLPKIARQKTVETQLHSWIWSALRNNIRKLD